jgi:glycosyltransferase involved in cell wall biosynthesis
MRSSLSEGGFASRARGPDTRERTVMPKFTVFTPTFNRARLLPRVYDCLRGQTFHDFEWLIVDDGSTDGTREMVEEWQRAGELEIVYLHQENRGKHVAFNRGVARARGELLLPLDSDDVCIPSALERLLHWWLDIPQQDRAQYSGVSCQCADNSGRIVGACFPSAVADAYPVDFLLRLRVPGERWGFSRVDLLRAFPFPENPGERFVPEGLVWNRIGSHYKMRFISEALRIYEPLPGGLTNSLVRLRTAFPQSTCQYYREYLQFKLPLAIRARTLINYVRFYFHCRRLALLRSADFAASAGSVMALPLGYIASLLDRLRTRLC